MKIEDYISTVKAELEQLERAFHGMKHTLASEGTVVEVLQGLLGMIDVEQRTVEQIAMVQTESNLARALIDRTDQLVVVRKLVVQA